MLKKNLFLSLIFTITTLFSAQQSYSSVSTQQQPPLSAEQIAFIDAEKAINRYDKKAFEIILTSLKNYPLTDYLRRDQIIQQLRQNKPSTETILRIQNFLTKHNNQVVSRKLRYLWLSYLSDTNQNSLFLSEYQASNSLKLKCQYLTIKLTNTPLLKPSASKDIQSEIQQIWLTGQSLPKFCDPLIKQWRATGSLNDDLIWRRMLLAVNSKRYQLAEYLNRQRSAGERSTGEFLIKVMRQPRSLITTQFKARISDKGQTIIFKGLNQLAWDKPLATIKLWEKLSSKIDLSNRQISQLKRSIGLALAIDSNPKAADWLRSLDNETDPSVDQWLLSSALAKQDWNFIDFITRKKGRQTIDVDKWRYWRAVSTKNNGFIKTSNWLMESLADERSYYGFLAATSLNIKPQLNNSLSKIDNERLEQLKNKPAAKRALQFYQLKRLTEARQEWNSLVADSTDDDLVTLAQLAHSWGWDHQSILAFAKSKKIDDLAKRFPFYQIDKYRTESHQQQIPMTWAYAITRQESAFKVDAFSGAGAVGLMQLKPSTARLVAKRVAKKKSGYKVALSGANAKHKLKNADLNIKLGIAHLKEMLDYYNGHPVLATAAYNAGKHRVNQWLKDNTISDSVLWIEQIPYRETREYVKNVLTYQQIYAELDQSNDSFINKLQNYPIPTVKISNSQATGH